jgi:hypothetical protein
MKSEAIQKRRYSRCRSDAKVCWPTRTTAERWATGLVATGSSKASPTWTAALPAALDLVAATSFNRSIALAETQRTPPEALHEVAKLGGRIVGFSILA